MEFWNGGATLCLSQLVYQLSSPAEKLRNILGRSTFTLDSRARIGPVEIVLLGGRRLALSWEADEGILSIVGARLTTVQKLVEVRCKLEGQDAWLRLELEELQEISQMVLDGFKELIKKDAFR